MWINIKTALMVTGTVLIIIFSQTNFITAITNREFNQNINRYLKNQNSFELTDWIVLSESVLTTCSSNEGDSDNVLSRFLVVAPNKEGYNGFHNRYIIVKIPKGYDFNGIVGKRISAVGNFKWISNNHITDIHENAVYNHITRIMKLNEMINSQAKPTTLFYLEIDEIKVLD